MPATPPSFQDESSFLGGVDGTGTVVSPSFATYNGEGSDKTPSTPNGTATYNATSSNAFKWGSSTPGTASGTITYAFNPASNYTTVEQGVYASSFALWSAEANVTFALASSYTGAGLQLTRGADRSAFATGNNNSPVMVGGTTLGVTTAGLISVDTSGNTGFGPLTSVNGGSGYPAGTVVHEIGHALGLGHGGPYNGASNSATDQYSQYDTGLYSVMSYIAPSDATAKYNSTYSVTGTNWGGYQGPETPMSIDIVALQNLYGLPTSTPLSGNQIFGYNSNITGLLANYFDFTQNTQPVLTLWDAGGNNTLNLSGYSTASTVNLNAGSFSSTNGLTNNIGIALNTAINTAVGGAGDDVFTVNAAADTIDGGVGANTVKFSGNKADYTLSNTAGTVSVTKLSNSVLDTLTNVTTLTFADQSIAASSIACFTHGTLIETASGEVAVEDLAIGDMVMTARGVLRPIKWLGYRSYAGRFLKANAGVRPIRFAAGSLGGELPRRDLLISPEHAMFLAGALFPARALVNGTSIAPDLACERVDYVHVELDSHDVILAEGAASETFIDDDSRATFHNAASYAALYGASDEGARFCAPRVEHGFALENVRAALPNHRSIAA